MIKSLEEIKINGVADNLYIYGAGAVAKEIRLELSAKGITVKGFLVGDLTGNPNTIDGIKVSLIDDFDTSIDYRLIVGVGNKLRKSVIDVLLKKGFFNLIIMDKSLTAKVVNYALIEKRREFFKDTDYELNLPEGMEIGTAIIVDREGENKGSWRIGIQDWDDSVGGIDKNELLKNGRLKKNFEHAWGEYQSAYDFALLKDANDIDLTKVLDVFLVRCHLDAPIHYIDGRSYIHEIQAGASLTSDRIVEYTDDVGDNISDKNRDFSECSAIYWIWKNVKKKDYIGIYHYRRHLKVDDNTIRRCFAGGVDVINTIPNMVFPSVKEFFNNYFAVLDFDWQIMLEAIQNIYPEYYDRAVTFLSESFYLANNVFIMKSELFDKMCEFVFAILLYIDNFYREKGLIRNDRYAGYLFEVLYGLFIMINSSKINIAYADMLFCARI